MSGIRISERLSVIYIACWYGASAFSIAIPLQEKGETCRTRSLEPTAAARFSSTMIESHNIVVAGVSTLPAAVAQFHRWTEGVLEVWPP